MTAGRDVRQWIHLIDLATGTRHTMPGDHGWFHLVAVHGGAVYAKGKGNVPALRWTPGTDPAPLLQHLQQIDPLTGTARAVTRGGVLLLRPDGSTHLVPVDTTATM